MRLGIFGGTFDPPHIGHLVLAETVRDALSLDEVRFIPAADPPHKDVSTLSPGPVRAELVSYAIAGHEGFRLDKRELARPGVSYTVDTLRELKSELPDADLFFLMGADSLQDLPTWREPGEIAQLARLAVVRRVGDSLDIPPSLADELAGRVEVVDCPLIELSASDIRQRVRDGLSIRYRVPRAVEIVLAERGLYGGAEV